MAFAEDQVDALLMINQGYDNLQRHFHQAPLVATLLPVLCQPALHDVA